MTHPLSSFASFRGLRAAVLAALVFGHLSMVIPASAAPAISVVSVQSTRIADLILLDGGFDAGLRQGMVCRITRGTIEIAQLLLVELRPTCSAALILGLTPGQSIRARDVASIKILKT